MLKYFFWITWSIETVLMIWWLFDELKLKYIPMNPVVIIGFIYLPIALFVYLSGKTKAAMIMVGIPAIPLLIMGLFLLVVMLISIFSGPIRWN